MSDVLGGNVYVYIYICIYIYIYIYIQCSKLRVHPAPCVHGFNAGCTILKAVHPACAPFSLIISVYLSLCALYLNSGCRHFPPTAPGRCTHLNINFEH